MSTSTLQFLHLPSHLDEEDTVGWEEEADWRMKRFEHLHGHQESWILAPLNPFEERRETEVMSVSLSFALSRYKAGLVSLGRAAEIAGLPYDKMMDELQKHGISLRIGPSSVEEAERRGERLIAALKQLRRSS